MVIASALSAPGISSGVAAQVQQRQAQRNADQAESQARALQSQARDAQAVASRAQDDASSLKVRADQAEGHAFNARQGVAVVKSWDSARSQLNSVLTRAVETLKSPDTAAKTEVTPASLAPVVNVFGQQTGTVVNVTA